ncbi:hypothetical protein L0Z72_12265 [candidate division KSB1 bacterium]|nr:hypothetical protein [candidate division KSB1 bacterium]
MIKVTARVAVKEIPLNRPLIFTVQVEWSGDLNRYEIGEVEQPVVKNFIIKSNSSADRREVVNGQLKAIREFDFELTPQELGMGYIEGVIVKYLDKASGESKHLITNRLDVKVIEPIREPGSYQWMFKWIILGVCLIALLVALVLSQRKKADEKRRLAEAVKIVPVEEKYLQELKDTIPLNSPDLDLKNSFSHISLILRKYLSDKYNFSATKVVADEIIDTLKQNNLPDRLSDNVKEILNTSDVVKFSGGEGARSDLERIYTLMENLLNEGMRQTANAGNLYTI